MHQLLASWLDKIGVKHLDELSDDERATFDNWKLVLSKDELEMSDLIDYFRKQLARIEYVWRDTSLNDRQVTRLVDQHIVYKNLLNIHNAPKEEKERLEKQLNDLIRNIKKK